MLRQLWATVHLPLAEGVPELSEYLLQLRIDGYRPRSKIFVLLGLFRELLFLLGDFGLQVAVAPLLQNEVVSRGVEEVEEVFLGVLGCWRAPAAPDSAAGCSNSRLRAPADPYRLIRLQVRACQIGWKATRSSWFCCDSPWFW